MKWDKAEVRRLKQAHYGAGNQKNLWTFNIYFFLSLAFLDMLVCHSPQLYGSLCGHVQVWNSICCADMARAG